MQMHKILSTQEMRQAEQDAVLRGVSLLQLMENAGVGAAKALLAVHPQAAHGLMICGKGNNGGDALVMARVLAQSGVQSDILFVMGENVSALSQINRDRLPENTQIYQDCLLSDSTNWCQYDFVVDAVFGTGFSGSLPLPIAQIFQKINELPIKRCALDIASGIDCDTGEVAENTFVAHHTFAFGALKPAHIMDKTQAYCGQVTLIDIGI